jgi:hypothetical protein
MRMRFALDLFDHGTTLEGDSDEHRCTDFHPPHTDRSDRIRFAGNCPASALSQE